MLSSGKVELTASLAEYPSHFDLECPSTIMKLDQIKDRIKDEEDFYESKVNLPCLREHFKCRDLNLVLHLNYKSSMLSWPGNPLQMKHIRKMIDFTKEYPDSMIALSNLARLKLQQQQFDDAERCLKQLKEFGPWERVLADAEMAYACRRMGPLGHWKCKELSEKIIYLRDYPGLTGGTEPEWLNELKMEYSYEAALAIQRLFNSSSHTNIFVGAEVTPERLMTDSAELLKTVAMSTLSDSVSVYQTLGWLMLSETFRLYRRVRMFPTDKRTLRIVDFEWPGLDSVEQCLQKAVEAVETTGLSNTPFRILLMLGNEFRRERNRDLDKAKRYLKQAAKLSTKPAIHHHLSLIYKQKWLENHDYNEDKRHHNVNVRDPGHPLLKKAIMHLEKANEYARGTSVLFHVELARLKFSYSQEPISKENRDDIMDTLNGCILCIEVGQTTYGVQLYLFHQLALMHQVLFNDAFKYRQNLELSVEKSLQCMQYSEALPLLKEMVEAQSPNSERYRNLGEMYTIFKRYNDARWNLEKARELNPGDPDILENLVVSLIGLEEFHAAKKCLMILKGMDPSHLERPEHRERYIHVTLKAAQKFSADTAASIYRELIKDLHPKIAGGTVVVISSEEPSDTVRTKALVRMIRKGLGFNEDNCILPMEAVWKLHGDMDRKIADYLEYFLQNAWCIVIHLTDMILGEGLEYLLMNIDNSIEYILKRKGHVVVVDDVTTRDSTDWKQSTGQMRKCQPWISYSELIDPNLETVTAEETDAAEQVEVPRDEPAAAQELVEDCAAALQDMQMTDKDISVTELNDATQVEYEPEIQPWTRSALERLVRAMLSASE